jgi:hypothetical protein
MKIYNNSNNNNIAYFDSSIQFISVPKDFISFLKTEILHPYIINQSCIINGYFNLRQIECDCDVIYNSTFHFELTFILFNDIKLTIPKHLLFEQYGKTCGMLIEENTSTKTEWILGEPLFKQYYMQFNLNEQSITFYISSSYSHKLLLTLTLYKFIIIFLIINSLFILFPYIHILK